MKNAFLTTGEDSIGSHQLMSIQVSRSIGGRPYQMISAFSSKKVLPRTVHYGSRTFSLALTKELRENQVFPGEDGDVIVDSTLRDAIRRRNVIGVRLVMLGFRRIWTDPEGRLLHITYPRECALYEEKE